MRTWLKQQLAIACCVIAFISMPLGLRVEAQSLTPQQLQQLRSLSPSQRQLLMEALSGQGVSANSRARSAKDAEPSVDEFSAANEGSDQSEEVPENTGLEAGDTVVIRLELSDEKTEIMHDDLRLALGSRVYQLDGNGDIDFPKVGRIGLRGLDADQVVLRLESEPDLQDFLISASVLPLLPSGVDALQPFGFELFDGADGSFAADGAIPVPLDYTVGAGDSIIVQTFGGESATMTLMVERDGQVFVPNVGPVVVAGLSFEQVRSDLVKRIEKQAIGVEAVVSMGELRSIRVFVLGDVKRPGAYTVSGLSTITNALFASGGLLETGSMRNVQLKRRNRVVGKLDLYDMMLRGNNAGDVRVRSGDVVFVPPLEQRVSIYGSVQRPAIYEVEGDASLQGVIELSGGLLPSAFLGEARIIRFNSRGRTDILTVSLRDAARQTVLSGDTIQILPALQDTDNAVALTGHVQRPGKRQWRPGMRLTDLISSADELVAGADLEYVLIHRRVGPNQLSRLVSANLNEALASPTSAANTRLEARDEVAVFSLGGDRAERIKPLLDIVREQSKLNAPTAVVTVSGSVRAPGDYPLESGMRVSDLIRAAGGLVESAYIEQAEITRQIQFNDSDKHLTVHDTFDLEAALARDPTSDRELAPFDFVTIRDAPEWRKRETIELRGEVRFPGVYAIARGEYLSAVIERAGGLTDLSFTEGSIFLREELREREREQLERLSERVRREYTALPVDQIESRSSAEQLLDQIEDSEPQGRLVIDVDELMRMPGNESVDILVKAGDRLFIPPRSQEVTVIGEVQYATSHIYTPGLDRRGYILKSGDVTANADVKRVYVVRANGNVVTAQRSAWFVRAQNSAEIRPGDTIVVPLDADRISSLSLWTSATQIVYNIGVAAAAVASF